MCEGREEGVCDDEAGVVVWERRARVVLLVWRVEGIVRDVEGQWQWVKEKRRVSVEMSEVDVVGVIYKSQNSKDHKLGPHAMVA